MRWWPSRPTNNGVVSLCLQLPFLPKTGMWTIRVKVRGQVQEKQIAVEKYYVPRYEVRDDARWVLAARRAVVTGGGGVWRLGRRGRGRVRGVFNTDVPDVDIVLLTLNESAALLPHCGCYFFSLLLSHSHS